MDTKQVSRRAYLNTAATSLHHPPEVEAAMIHALRFGGNAGRGAAHSAMGAARTIDSARFRLAEFFGGSSERVMFAKNATEALNVALFGLLAPGDTVITTELEHNSVLRPLYTLEQNGVHLSFLSTDAWANPVWDELPMLVKKAEGTAKVLVTTAMSNVTGNLVDVQKVGKMARDLGLLYVLDAAQGAGSIPLSIHDCDVICFTGHKGLMGPQGIGGLIVGENVSITPRLYGGTGVLSKLKTQPDAYPTRLEAGTQNGVGIAGLDAGVHALEQIGLSEIERREKELLDRFLSGISDIPGIHLYGDFRGAHGPVVSLSLEGIASAELAELLDVDFGVDTRAGLHCAPLMHGAIGTAETGTVRFSWNGLTEDWEIDQAIDGLLTIAKEIQDN